MNSSPDDSDNQELGDPSNQDISDSQVEDDDPSSSARNDSHQELAPRDGKELEAIVIQATCGQCWAYPNRKCGFTGPDLHLARYERAYKKGVVTAGELELAKIHVRAGKYVVWPD